MPHDFLPGDAEVSPDLVSKVQAELDPDERLLWVGQSLPGHMARRAIPLVFFGIPFTAFALFWMFMASGWMFVGGPQDYGMCFFFSCFPLFGIPFIIIGL